MKMSRVMLRQLQNQSGTATLQKVDVAAIFDEKKATAVMNAFFRNKQAEIQGLDLVLTLNLPGRILRMSKNLRLGKNANQFIARVDAASIKTPEDLIRNLAPCFWVEFDSSKCAIRPAKPRTPNGQ